ncbi:MAG TPA: hypothetical protein DFS52_22085 [Myxococcales bacterium]|jgi:hypothetical protein|nr:hypothetical protein [Myxococcales bacterium]
MRSPVFKASVLAFAACAVFSGCSCEEPVKTTRVAEEFTVVQGNPAVDTGKPAVQQEEAQTPQFQFNVPRQCDFFQQNAVRKVDILWVVDNSGSMKSSQANLAAEFPKFIDALVSLQPPIDFHIGVTSTDTENTQLIYNAERDGEFPPDRNGTNGLLHGFDLTEAGGTSGRYIACDAAGNCNVPRSSGVGNNVAAAFEQMSKVGTGGSAVERGLQAAYLALTRSDNLRAEDPRSADISKKYPFIRPDAALFVVFVSDEDDSSCAPFVPLNSDGRPVSGEPCQADPGCRCDAASLTYGSTNYFVRFLESYKNFGHSDLVAAGAVVCTQKEPIPSQGGDPDFMHTGCPDDGTGIAYFGERYIDVASKTGGTAISIRGSFANALQSLGFAVSGLRQEFRLSRGPMTETIEVYVTDQDSARCTSDADCEAGQICRGATCALRVEVGARSLQGCTPSELPLCETEGASDCRPALEYCKCDASSFRNIIRFNVDGQPPAQSSTEVCYDVNTNFNQACQ